MHRDLLKYLTPNNPGKAQKLELQRTTCIYQGEYLKSHMGSN